MFFDGGIRGFFDDLYYGAVEKGYKLTHPRIWDSVLKSQAEAMDDSEEDYKKVIDVLRFVGVEDEELFGLIEKAEDMENLSQEDAEDLMAKLREKKGTVDFSKLAEILENDNKKETSYKSDDLKEILRIVNKRWDPYDTFPEEKKNYSIEEIMEILQRLCHMGND